ncbi:asparaginase [Microbacteriaceae bacterium VKM Ac-2855]|nr:asparaginase [Microbacteriaceae bacterium VKM Ac-2855]
MQILVLATGGTIDKEYSIAGDLEIGEPQSPRILADVITPLEFVHESVLRKDSLDLDDADRAAIRAHVEATAHERIVVTHGTDTMTATAETLRGIPGRVIVLTGAMQPARMRDSDAAFNLGLAIGAVQLLPEGVYIAMSGQVFPAGAVAKDREAGVFHRA